MSPRKAAIVTDSTAGLPDELVEGLGVHVVPVLLIQEGQTFLDGVDMSPTEVYRRLRSGAVAFTSAAPTVQEFLDVYQAAAQGASGVLSIHMSPELGSTYGVALAAREQVDGAPTVGFNCNSAARGSGGPDGNTLAGQARALHTPGHGGGVRPAPDQTSSDSAHLATDGQAATEPAVGAHTGPDLLGIAFYTE